MIPAGHAATPTRKRLLRVAEYDPTVARASKDVGDLVAPPKEVMRPRILSRVLGSSLHSAPAAPTEPCTAVAADLTPVTS